MILPVAHTKIHPDQKLGESVQQLLLAKIAVYLMTFLIVTVAWAAHVRLFQVIEHIDDVLALLNLACMMIITFLPYTELPAVQFLCTYHGKTSMRCPGSFSQAAQPQLSRPFLVAETPRPLRRRSSLSDGLADAREAEDSAAFGFPVTAAPRPFLPVRSVPAAAAAARMIPPVQVSPLIKFTRYSALLVGMIYGKKRYDYLKPIAEEERRIEAEEKKKREELERIAKELAEASEDSILK
ncbi:endosomal/lysosomal proton channel TMEM175 isoform X2 [Serinus canaria]|nr:endosomal/lysosomal proton channel TMEM175 isoform X2 [Serinus canaria]